MPRIVSNDLVLLRPYSYATTAKQVGINDCWYLCGGHTGLGCTDVQFAASLSSQLGAVYIPALAIDASFLGVTVNVFHLANDPTLTVIDKSGAGTGTSGLNMVPGQVAGMIKKRGAVGGRRGQGRIFIPFPSTAESDANGFPTVAYQVLLHNIASVLDTVQTIGTAPDQSTLVSCLHSRADGFTTIILSHTETSLFGTQRRRGNYGRQNPVPF